jgi:hypothetical protein
MNFNKHADHGNSSLIQDRSFHGIPAPERNEVQRSIWTFYETVNPFLTLLQARLVEGPDFADQVGEAEA